MTAAPGGHSAKALKHGYSTRDEARWIRSAGFAASLIGLTSAVGSVRNAPRQYIPKRQLMPNFTVWMVCLMNSPAVKAAKAPCELFLSKIYRSSDSRWWWH